MDGRHRPTALKKRANASKSFAWKSDGLPIFSLTMHEGSPLPFRATVQYGRSFYNQSAPVLFDVQFFETMSDIFTDAKTFGHHYGNSFSDVQSNDIVLDLKAYNFPYCDGYLLVPLRQEQIAHYLAPCRTFPCQDESSKFFGITDLQVSSLVLCD